MFWRLVILLLLAGIGWPVSQRLQKLFNHKLALGPIQAGCGLHPFDD
jgi:hypothetical protein